MNTLSEQQYIRTEKLRKQELYRNMLDQQVRYNEGKRQKDVQHLKHPFYDGRYANQRNSLQINSDEGTHLPPLAHQQSNREGDWQSNKHSYSKSITEQDKTQLYLNNCEEIIKNLRDLKNKKRKWESPSVYHDTNSKRQLEKQKNKSYEVQYYPKHNYFSSSGSAYNKNGSLQPSPKHFKMPSSKVNALDEPKLSNDKYSKKGGTSSKGLRNKRALEKVLYPTDNQTKSPERAERDQEKLESNESQSPLGIREQSKIPRKPSKLRHKFYKMVGTKKQAENHRESEKSQLQQMQEQDEQTQNAKSQQQQLSACVIELTKYLKTLNEQRQGEKEIQKMEADKKRTQDEQSINQTAKISKKKYQSEKIQQRKDVQITQNQSTQPHSLSKTEKDNSPQRQFTVLKDRVIQALKKLGQKSHDFLLKMSDHTGSMSRIQPKQRDTIQQSPSKNSQPENKPKVNIQNEQLVKMLITHLEKHDDNSEELNRCLKELHQYLRYHNQQLKELRSHRDSQVLNQQTHRKFSKKSLQKEEFHSLQKNNNSQQKFQRNSRENELKLQEAILKNLKKARMRGNLFKERVENYRKEHPMQDQKQTSNRQKQETEKKKQKVQSQRQLEGKPKQQEGKAKVSQHVVQPKQQPQSTAIKQEQKVEPIVEKQPNPNEIAQHQ